jgi:class 3 adenylate cyclase
MGVRVAFLDAGERAEVPTAPAGVLVPSRAIARDESGDFVFLVEDERLQRRSVTRGERLGSRIQVLAGLASGEVVVADLGGERLQELTEGDLVSGIREGRDG